MVKNKVSILIPSRNEIFLNKTIRDVLEKAEGDVEVIANVDETWPEELVEDKRVTYLHPPEPKGMRAGINACVNRSEGEYVLKADGHCMFAPGFDTALKADMQDNWIVIPGRHSLDAENWTIQQNGKSRRDYHYLCYPDPTKGHDLGIHGVEWPERSRLRANDHQYDIDETMSFQGSCWFMKRDWFTEFLGGMSEYGYGTFSQEPQEIGMKTWLGGGQVMVNKKTWYAHLHKGKQYGRMYHQDKTEVVNGHNYSAWYWATNQWEDRIHDIDWFIDKFWPVPTWPENYREKIDAFWIPFGKEQGYA